MNNEYLLEEITASLDEIASFSSTLNTQSLSENLHEMINTLDEAEMLVEHLASCIVSLKMAL